jgi:hypothetical protein
MASNKRARSLCCPVTSLMSQMVVFCARMYEGGGDPVIMAPVTLCRRGRTSPPRSLRWEPTRKHPRSRTAAPHHDDSESPKLVAPARAMLGGLMGVPRSARIDTRAPA